MVLLGGIGPNHSFPGPVLRQIHYKSPPASEKINNEPIDVATITGQWVILTQQQTWEFTNLNWGWFEKTFFTPSRSLCLLQCLSEHHRGRTCHGSFEGSPSSRRRWRRVRLLRTHAHPIPTGASTLVRGDGSANRRDGRRLGASGRGTLELDFAFSPACIKRRRRHPVVVCADNPVDVYKRTLPDTRGFCESCKEAV